MASKNEAILKELSQLETFKDRVELAEKELEHISSGSSRIVYGFGDNQILKLAKNDKGLAQNKAESNPAIKSKYVNETLKSDKDGVWKISPRREKITEKEFKEMTELNFKDFGEALDFALKSVSDDKDVKKPKHYEEMSKKDIFKEVVRVAKKADLLPGDLSRISSWGKTKDHPILLDTGLTKGIFSSHYESGDSKSKSSKSKSSKSK